MKRFRTPVLFLALAVASLATHAQTSSGDPLSTMGNKVLTWITGPFGVLVVTLGFVFGGLAIMFGHGSEGWKRIAQVLIGGAVLLGAVQIVHLFIQ